MDEFFLHFLWKYQKFSILPLTTTKGEPLTVLKTGNQNAHSGPDFSEGKIKIGTMIWSGSIEIHYRASDWQAHAHDGDAAYENVILHTVWIADKEICYPNGTEIPCLCLKDFINPDLTQQYKAYINQPQTIRCSASLPEINHLKITSMLDKAAMHRLERKAKAVLEVYEQLNHHWEETAYQITAAAFGFSVNKSPFETLTKQLPYKVIAKHLDHPKQIEALIFGMSGLLEDAEDAYQSELQKEFQFLRKKYELAPSLTRSQWRFAKMRPPNFPTVRLAQFAQLLQVTKGLFAQFTHAKNFQRLIKLMRTPPSAYWREHYDFGKKLKSSSNQLGKNSAELILINSAAPLLAAYSIHIKEHLFMEKAITLLEQLQPEKNFITKKWTAAGISTKTALDTQALIEQHNEFCLKKRCLNCNIGVSLLNR